MNPRVLRHYVLVLVRTIVNHRMVLYLLIRNILLMQIIIPILLLCIRYLLLLILLLAISCRCVSRVVFSFFFFICVLLV